MSKQSTLSLFIVCCVAILQAQTLFNNQITIPAGYAPTTIVMPPSPLTTQILFIGGTDTVQTTATYGNPAGQTVAKEWHDFIGITPDNSGQSLGWVSVNHEMVQKNNKIGDGGGMTTFRIKRGANDQIEIMNQTLPDGRSGKFFNVDFVNTVGETGMNCGGISSMVDGRIWTAEEWFVTANNQISGGVTDTSNFTVTNSAIPGWNGVTLKKYENFNWMVEIDPKNAKAIRKQYNWGRQPFEGGAIEPGNTMVYLGPDDTPGFFGMFVAQTPGDFNRGTLFAYKQNKGFWKWEPIWEAGSMLNHQEVALQKGCNMFNRIEWVAIDPANNFVYFTETGVDNPSSALRAGQTKGGTFHSATVARAQSLGLSSPVDSSYRDYYGRIWKYNPTNSELSIYLEGGPFFATSPAEANYPSKHLTNPDGLSVATIDDRSYLVIQEDLNGTSNGRTPAGVSNRLCEVYLLDLSIQNPTINDLIRLTAVPAGAEVTGVIQTPDKKSLLINSQHPATTNPFPFNHSLTYAIHGLDKLKHTQLKGDNPFAEERAAESGEKSAFSVYPNPTTRTVYLNKTTDVALYNQLGSRVRVFRNVNEITVSDLESGIYYIQNAEGETLKLAIEK